MNLSLNYTIKTLKGKILIQGKNIALWALEKYDLIKNLAWANDRELIHLTGMPVFPKSLSELEIWYNQSTKNSTNKFFTIKNKQTRIHRKYRAEFNRLDK